ncbi:MAG: T9SS type A sorting domain-containing protein [Muribaculaceae bacterium]
MIAALLAASFTAYGADASEAANIKVLWQTVDIERGASTSSATVTARIQVVDGKTFDAPVYPILYSVSGGLEYGEAKGQQVTLPASGRNVSSTLTWDIDVSPTLLRNAGQKVLCIMYFRDNMGKAVELSRVEVSSAGTTGVSAPVANAHAVTEIYDITGTPVARGENPDLVSLPRGIYILRTGTTVSKIIR